MLPELSNIFFEAMCQDIEMIRLSKSAGAMQEMPLGCLPVGYAEYF